MPHRHVFAFSDNSPTVSWATRMVARHSRVVAHLIRVLALRMKIAQVCPLTPLHIPGKQNAIANVPSRSFSSNPAWTCHTDIDLLTLFNKLFPLPQQASWTTFRLNSRPVMRVIPALRMKAIMLAEWQRLPKIGRHTGTIGSPTSNLWEWTLTCRQSRTPIKCDSSWDLPPGYAQGSTGADATSNLAQSMALSQPLARRLRWHAAPTPPNLPAGTN